MYDYKELERIYESIEELIPYEPEIGIILGSGLGDFAEKFESDANISYASIDKFPISTVASHKGRYVFTKIGNKKCVIMQGRVHLYEGYQVTDVVLPIRLMKLMGIKNLILTNSAGGINFNFTPGDIMMITDQISSFVTSALVGPNIDELGIRFPGMSEVYDKHLQEIIRETAKEIKVDLKEGVYIQTYGPAFETPAEVKMYRMLGADAVAMSTAVEAVAAKHMDLKICGFSCITNKASGMDDEELDDDSVVATANLILNKLTPLLTNAIQKM